MSKHMGLISGQEGESLFDEPVLRIFKHNPLPELFTKISTLADERLVAIVSALVVEQRLDVFLGAFLPRYGRLIDGVDFTLSTKVALAESFAFIPPRILRAATVIRKIRNEFAHNLEIEAFSQLEAKLIENLRKLRLEIWGHIAQAERRPKKTLREEHYAVSFYCITGLTSYRENLECLRSSIEEPAFIQKLVKQVAAQSLTQLDGLYNEPPISVEIRGDTRIETYAKGVTKISSVGGGPCEKFPSTGK